MLTSCKIYLDISLIATWDFKVWQKKTEGQSELLISCLDYGLQSAALSLSMCEEMQLHCGPLHQKTPALINH